MQEDVVVRALRFLEGFLQRDALQKAAFLKDLEGLWSKCDTRVLRYRVLPPLLADSRNEALQPVILPLIMRIVQKQDSQVWISHSDLWEIYAMELVRLAAVFETDVPGIQQVHGKQSWLLHSLHQNSLPPHGCYVCHHHECPVPAKTSCPSQEA